jgi:hypothetical protein
MNGKIEWPMRDYYAFSHGMMKKQMHAFFSWDMKRY